MKEWIKIEDGKPPLDTDILVADDEDISFVQLREMNLKPEYKQQTFCAPVGIDGFEYSSAVSAEQITHWMFAPKMPKTK